MSIGLKVFVFWLSMFFLFLNSAVKERLEFRIETRSDWDIQDTCMVVGFAVLWPVMLVHYVLIRLRER